MIRTALHLALALVVTSSSGCVLLDAGLREARDHGRHARYENKSYGEHALDALFEDDDEECETTVVVYHDR